MDVRIKFGDSRSNRARGIRAAHFVMDNERRTNEAGEPSDLLSSHACHYIWQSAILTFCLKKNETLESGQRRDSSIERKCVSLHVVVTLLLGFALKVD